MPSRIHRNEDDFSSHFEPQKYQFKLLMSCTHVSGRCGNFYFVFVNQTSSSSKLFWEAFFDHDDGLFRNLIRKTLDKRNYYAYENCSCDRKSWTWARFFVSFMSASDLTLAIDKKANFNLQPRQSQTVVQCESWKRCPIASGIFHAKPWQLPRKFLNFQEKSCVKNWGHFKIRFARHSYTWNYSRKLCYPILN